jgi:uncharacterized protein CbrC (UPF0167 family)
MSDRRSKLLRPIGKGDHQETLRLLCKGFPQDSPDIWRRRLERQASLQDDGHGYMLEAGGAGVGVLLTLKSRRLGPDGRPRDVVNLSSWFIEPAYRWSAIAMLRAAMADKAALYTDLTAAPQVAELNRKVGMESWSSGMILASAAPFAVLPGRRGARVLPLVEAAGLIEDHEKALLDWHQREGLIAAVLIDGAAQPLLFRVISRKGVRFAQLVFAPSRAAVIGNLPTIMRYLARSGLFFVTIDADRAMCPPGAFFRPGRHRFRSGPGDRDGLDYAYSELVLFGVS